MERTAKGVGTEFQRRAAEVAEGLRTEFVRLLDSLKGGARDGKGLPVSLQRTLRSRLGRALEEADPLVCLFHMPGPEGLRQMLDIVREGEAEGDAAAVARCEARIHEYETLLEEEGASREMFRTILGGFLPEERRAALRESAQVAFKSMAQIVGYCAESIVVTTLVCPGSRPDQVTIGSVWGVEGWRRLRSDAWYHVSGYAQNDRMETAGYTSLDGQALTRPALLEDFCSDPVPIFAPDESGSASYRLQTDEVGARSACTFYFGHRLPDAGRCFRSAEADMAFFSVTVAQPCKRLLFDVLVHRGIWEDAEAAAECYRVVPRGMVAVRRIADLASRATDRVHDGATLRSLPHGLRGLDVTRVKSYGPMIEYAVGALGLRAEDFRGYRCEQAYPVYGCQYAMRFDLP